MGDVVVAAFTCILARGSMVLSFLSFFVCALTERTNEKRFDNKVPLCPRRIKYLGRDCLNREQDSYSGAQHCY
jgi:hypothetical protein